MIKVKSTLKRAGYNRVHKQMNDVFLQFTAKVVFLIILMFSLNLFFAGHYTPGGGFVGGLLAAAAIILLLLAYDRKTMERMLKVDYKIIIVAGLSFAVAVPLLSFLFGTPFFTHQHTYIDLPILGEVALHSAVLFDIGVYLIVAGATLLIIILLGAEKR